MNRSDLLKLNCFEEFQNSIQKYIDVFVDYYGEDKRSEIEEKFSRAMFIGYVNPQTFSMTLYNLKKDKANELKNKALLDTDLPLNKEDLFSTTSFDFPNLFPITYFSKLKELFLMGSSGRKDNFINNSYVRVKEIIPTITKEEYLDMVNKGEISDKYNYLVGWKLNNIKYFIDINNSDNEYRKCFKNCSNLLRKVEPEITLETFNPNSESMKKLSEVALKCQNAITEYQEFLKDNQAYFSLDEENSKIKKSVNDKYYKLFLSENMDLINLNDVDIVKKYINGECDSLRLPHYISDLFGLSVGGSGCIDAFSFKNEEILNNLSEKEWKKKSIRDDRIKYFKSKGIDLGDDYNSYLHSVDAKRVWPDQDRIDKFTDNKNKLSKMCSLEYFSMTSFYKKIMNLINSKELLDKDIAISPDLFDSFLGKTFVNPNLICKDGNYELSSLVVISFNQSDGNIDHDIIHELNHLYELSLESVVDGEYTCLCGWDIMDGKIDSINHDYVSSTDNVDERREYELFNEIINELIAQEIETKMHKNDIYIMDSKKKSRVKYLTDYENTLFLVRDFFNEFKNEIIKSRSNGNINSLFDVVGKENFDEINSLFKIYNDNFSGFKIYNLVSSLSKHEDNELTRVFYDLANRSHQIVERMKVERDKMKDDEYNL